MNHTLSARHDAARLWRLTSLLAGAALGCALLLAGLSAWFLGSVALAGLSAAAASFNFHVPAALVRLFALGRTASRYGERLLGHQAALTDQTVRRIGLFAAMARAPDVRAAGWQLADQARLADYLDDVEDLDFARLRARLPARLLACGLVGSLLATAAVSPLALPPIALGLGAVALSLRALDRRGPALCDAIRSERRQGAQRVGAILPSVVALQAEGQWRARLTEALGSFSAADETVRTLRRLQARSDALAALLGPLAALSVVGAAWCAGARLHELLPALFVAFSWIALGESAQGVSRMLVAAIRRDAAGRQIAGWTAAAGGPAPARRHHALPEALSARGWQRRAPDGRPIGGPIDLELASGRPTLLAGPSGIGKTSLLKQIAGWLGDDVMVGGGARLGAADRRGLAMLCPHDAAVLTDTIRTNLFAPGRDDAALWDALAAVELTERIRRAGGLDGWIAQDTLSLGEAQRLNLARAWLSEKPLLLLDEPTEHLGQAQGRRILARLLDHARERIVVLASHDTDASAHVTRLVLG